MFDNQTIVAGNEAIHGALLKTIKSRSDSSRSPSDLFQRTAPVVR